jgi:pimeloyl-ACP methyl ester carboxylesterase
MSWWQQVAHFAPRWTCVTFAHRGFYPSSVIEGGPDPADYADDLAALVSHLELSNLRIVGQSMGGWTTVEYALRRPPALKGVVLSATYGTVDVSRIRQSELALLQDWLQSRDALVPKLLEAGIKPACGARMAAEQPALHQLYRHIDDMNTDWDKEALRQRQMDHRSRSPEDLRQVDCPILLVANEEDVEMPPVAAAAIAAVVPGADVAHIAKAGHSGYFERPQEFNRVVGEFLEKTRPITHPPLTHWPSSHGVTQGLIEGPLVRGPAPTAQNRKLVFSRVPS